MRITTEVVSLDGTGMNDRTQSAIVRDGVWEVCRDAYFNGGCIQLQPGRYSRMDMSLDMPFPFGSSIPVLQDRSKKRTKKR
jgi:hypothetical protein